MGSGTAGSNCATGSLDTRCTAIVAVTNAASLTFTKTADVSTTVSGGVVAYTVTAVNASTSAVVTNVTDPLAGIIDDADYNNDAAVVGGGTVSYAAPNLVWTGTVPAGGTITIRYTVTTHLSFAGGNQLLVGTLISTAPPESKQLPGNKCRHPVQQQRSHCRPGHRAEL